MQKIPCKMIALVASILVTQAHADPHYTVYGTLDLGVWSQTKTAGSTPRESAGSLTSINTGGISPSVFGLRGEESLDANLKLGLNLETHLDPSVGSSGLGAFWSRAANLALSGSWGAVAVGQQIDPAVLGYAATDPRGLRESLAGTQPWAMSSSQNIGPGTASPNNTLAFFSSNSISYTGTVDALTFGGLYAFGEVAGNSKANRVMSGRLLYSGAVTFSSSFHQSNWADSDHASDRKASLGVSTMAGTVSLRANYLHTKAFSQDGALTGDWEVVGLGAEAPISDKTSSNISVYFGRSKIDGQGSNKATSVIGSVEQQLSKRTTLYAQAAWINAGDAADGVVSVLGSQPVKGANTQVLNVGIRHRF